MTPEQAKPPKPYRIGEAVVRRPAGSAEQGASSGSNAALTALGGSARRREECGGHRWPPSIAEDDAADELLKSLSVSATPTEDLHRLFTHSRYTPTHDLSASTHRGVEQLRLALTEIVISHCEGTPELSSQDMRAVVAALDFANERVVHVDLPRRAGAEVQVRPRQVRLGADEPSVACRDSPDPSGVLALHVLPAAYLYEIR
jgi:hypothetical protein